MANASTLENLSPELLRVVERAQREPEGRFHSLAHLIDVPADLTPIARPDPMLEQARCPV